MVVTIPWSRERVGFCMIAAHKIKNTSLLCVFLFLFSEKHRVVSYEDEGVQIWRHPEEREKNVLIFARLLSFVSSNIDLLTLDNLSFCKLSSIMHLSRITMTIISFEPKNDKII